MPGDVDANVNVDARVQSPGAAFQGQNYGASASYGSWDGYDDPAHTKALEDIARQDQAQFRGGTTFSAPGDGSTAYAFDRYRGPSNNPYPVAAPVAPPVQVADPWDSLNDRGRVDSGVSSRLADPSAPWNAPPMVMDDSIVNPPVSRYSSYEEASAAKADIIADARNVYTARGDFAKIGTPTFNSEVQEALVSQGLAEEAQPEGHGKRGGHGAQQAGYAIGGALLELGSSASRLYQQENSGKYLTPEQQDTASAGMLSGGGALIGAVAGLALGNPMLGAMAGGAIGSLATGVITAGDERGQSTRESSESLVNSLGVASEKLKDFATQIEASGAQAQQFQMALGAAGSVGTFGPSTVQGVGNLTAAFGQYAGEDWKAISAYTTDPLLHGMGNKFSAGLAGSDDIASLGFDAAEKGDFGSLKTFQQAARDAKVANDPEFQRLAKNAKDDAGSWANQFGHAATGVLAHLGFHMEDEDPITQDQTRMADRKTALAGGPDPVAQAQNDLINQFADLKDQQIVAESGIKVAGAGIGLVEARGGSAAQIGAASGSLYSSLGAARSATQSEIGLLQKDMADPINAGRKDELAARIADAQARASGYELQEAQQQKRVFEDRLGEEDAGFGLSITRSTYSGQSAAQMYGRDVRQAEFLSGIAADPRNPLSPTERDGIEGNALRLKYQAGEDVFQENVRGAGISSARAGADLARADVLGTPLDAYNARLEQVGAEQQQLAAINGRLSQTIPFAERQSLLAQQAVLQGQIATGPEQARVAAYDSEAGILSDNQAAGRSQLSRNVAINGSSAYSPDIFAADERDIVHLRGAEDSSPVGSVQRARFGRERAGAEAALADDLTQSQIYRETSTQRTADNQAQHEYQRALIAPWMDGNPDSNPVTRGATLLGNLQSRLSGAQKALSSSTDPLAKEQNSAKVEDLQDQIAGIEHDRMFAIERLLPEMIAGAGGRGTLSGILPTKGQAAFFNGNPYVTGSWGPHAREAGAASLGDHPQMPGGAAGRMIAANGGNDPNLAALNRIVSLLEQVTRRGGSSPANLGGSSGGFNAMKPRNTDGEFMDLR